MIPAIEVHAHCAHGGGSLPYGPGRIDNAWRRRHDIAGTLEAGRVTTWPGLDRVGTAS
ncbi:hypothetical protein [Nonomuraea gerenzanensis]|uniref:Amidohydrolase n=1 Tax=Nonomuraea gerenzanensis TaxID=93944 RepID=A0A1M4EDC9_9ACTN|nr:hypothetical protein [Nonomuraea gerenzanensis]UBU18722.1 hypothetical protein LCN96_28005 [Nonomuraea gerenzanensis]SBO96583.1 hypothetical protein BN4615_P6099 [Nonomuraea gerenzanensis]